MCNDANESPLGGLYRVIKAGRIVHSESDRFIGCTHICIFDSNVNEVRQILEIRLRPRAKLLPEFIELLCAANVVHAIAFHANHLGWTRFLDFPKRSLECSQKSNALCQSLLQFASNAVHVWNQRTNTVCRYLRYQFPNFFVLPMVNEVIGQLDDLGSNKEPVLHKRQLTRRNFRDHLGMPHTMTAISNYWRHPNAKSYHSGKPCCYRRPIYKACGAQRRTPNQTVPNTHSLPPLLIERHSATPMCVLEAICGSTI